MGRLLVVGIAPAALLAVAPALAQVDWEEAPAPDSAQPPGSAALDDQEPSPGEAAPDASAAPESPARPLPPPPPPRQGPEPQAGGEPPSRISLETAPAGPTQPRTRRRHDGFYLRMNVGLGALGTDVDFDDDRAGLGLSGGALMLDLMLGATPAAGLTIGGGIWLGSLDEPHVEVDEDNYAYEPGGGTAQFLLGPFIDAFPNPVGGFHFGGGFGVGAISLPEGQGLSDDRETLDSGGVGGTIFGGWDGWISANWSLGVMLRFLAVRTRKESTLLQYDTTGRSFGVLFSALYH